MDVDVESNAERIELYQLLASFGYEMYRIGKQLTRIRSADELLPFPTNAISRTESSRRSPNGILSSLGKGARAVIPAKLLPKLGSIYYMIRPRTKKLNPIREIYAIKINSAV
jgi:hypothetical protein